MYGPSVTACGHISILRGKKDVRIFFTQLRLVQDMYDADGTIASVSVSSVVFSLGHASLDSRVGQQQAGIGGYQLVGHVR